MRTPAGRLAPEMTARSGLPRRRRGPADGRVRGGGHWGGRRDRGRRTEPGAHRWPAWRDAGTLHWRALAALRIGRRRDQDRHDRLQEVAECESANPASLIAKSPAMLVGPGAAQDLHPTRTTLVGGRRGDDPLWIKILSLYRFGIDDDAFHRRRASNAFSPNRPWVASPILRERCAVGRPARGETARAREELEEGFGRRRLEERLDQPLRVGRDCRRSAPRRTREGVRHPPSATRGLARSVPAGRRPPGPHPGRPAAAPGRRGAAAGR